MSKKETDFLVASFLWDEWEFNTQLFGSLKKKCEICPAKKDKANIHK